MTRDAEYQRAVHEAAGMIAVGLAEDLARPLAEVRELLGGVVSSIDEHVAGAKGPVAIGYEQSKAVRETLADAYLKSSNASRLATDLARAVSGGAVEACDLSRLIDDALGLVRHRFSAATELFVDHGSVGSVSLVGGELVLSVARILLHCASSTQAADEAAVSIRSRLVEPTGGRPEVTLTIAENGRGGSDDEIRDVTHLARELCERLGGSVSAAAAPESGATFVLRLPM